MTHKVAVDVDVRSILSTCVIRHNPPPLDSSPIFPHARAAWLGGSVARGAATPTSDLDIVVLTADDPVHRRSLHYSGWPVELFVHTDASMHKYFASDIARRQPSLPRMVGEALLLRDQDGDGQRWGQTARQVLSDGPAPLTQAELDDARYTITDLIDDLDGNPPPIETAAIAALLWQHVLTLSHRVEAVERHWDGYRSDDSEDSTPHG